MLGEIIWVGISLIVLGIVGTLITPSISNPVLSTLISHLSSVFIGVGLVEVIIHFFTIRRIVDRASTEVLRLLHLPLDNFYENRRNLGTLEQELDGVSEVWLAWHVGSIQGAGGLGPIVETHASHVRLILTHPGSPIIDELAKVFGRSKEAMQTSILELTLLAFKHGIWVRWFDGPMCNSIILADPATSAAWARLELVIPYARPVERPSIRISKAKARACYQKILASYEELWHNSLEPSSGVAAAYNPA